MVRISRSKFIFMLIAVGLFFTPYLLRDHFVSGGLYPVNILVWGGILGNTIWKHGISKETKFRKQKFVAVSLVIAYLVIFSYQGMHLRNAAFLDYIKFYIAIIVPILTIFIAFERQLIPEMFDVFLKILNFSVLFVVVCGLADVFMGHSVSSFFAGFYDIESLYSCYRQHRIVSYFGHSLLTAEIGIIYFVCNYIDVLYFHTKRNRVFFLAISFVLIALTGSKTALILLLVMSMLVNMDLKNFKYIIVIFIILLFLNYFGVFDMIINRFLYWGGRGDITSGRNSSLIGLYQSGVMKFSWFHGNDTGLSNTAVIAANEYPIIRWAFRFGILWTTVICSVIFVYPVIQILKWSRSWKILVLYSGCLVFVNTYSTLQSTQDGMLIYCIFTCLILNVSRFIGGKNEQQTNKSGKHY